MDCINARFRIFDPTDDLDLRFQNSMSFVGGDGWPESSVWSFYNLLTQVLARGPGYLGPKDDYIIKEININVLVPTDGTPHKNIVWRDQEPENDMNKRRRRMTDPRLFDTSVTPEERLAKYMTEKLGSVLRIGYSTMNYGIVFWENVAERMVFMVNGTEYKRFEMENLVENHKIDWWGTTPSDIAERKQKYRLWRRWLGKRRQRMKKGLEIDGKRPVTNIM